MSQFELAEMIFESDTGVEVDEMMRRTGTVESSVRTALHKLQRKDMVMEDGGRYFPHPDAGEDDLERIEPVTLDELRD